MSKAVNVSLKVGGYQISGFDDVEVGKSLYNLANMARLSFYEKDDHDLLAVKKIIKGKAEAVVSCAAGLADLTPSKKVRIYIKCSTAAACKLLSWL